MSAINHRWRWNGAMEALLLCVAFLCGCGAPKSLTNPSGQTGDGLQQQKPKEGKAKVSTTFNTSPVINSVVTQEGHIRPGQTVEFRVDASDPDGDILQYHWQDSCQGTLQSTPAAQVFWTAPVVAPASRLCTLQVEVFDGNGGRNWGELTVIIDGPVLPNLAPTLLSTLQSSRNIGRNKTVTLRVQAIDPEGLPLQFSWLASGGTLTTPTTTTGQSEVTWTPPATDCEFTILASIQDPTGLVTRHQFQVSINCP